ncbi:MAG: hypothetical protein JW727_06475 [Candidatus Aenigmarchaeota archaeon]|nr:hypothetical protein [Candidatus Aenigmarchaeota archaeon]
MIKETGSENLYKDSSLVRALNPVNGWKDLYRDLTYYDLFPESLPGGKTTQKALNVAAIPASFYALMGTPLIKPYVVAHELTHAATNIATGGTNEEIVIDSALGGDFLREIFPLIESKDLSQLDIAGYVNPDTFGPWPSDALVAIAPNAISMALGAELLYEAKKRKSLPLAIAGSSLVAVPVYQLRISSVDEEVVKATDMFKELPEGVPAFNVGDFSAAGGELVFEPLNALSRIFEENGAEAAELVYSPEMYPYVIAMLGISFLAGIAVAGTTYGLGRAAVNKLRRWKGGPSEDAPEPSQGTKTAKAADYASA